MQTQQQQPSLHPWQEAMATSATGAHSVGSSGRPNTPTGSSGGGNGGASGGGMDELLPLVIQLTNAEQVSGCASVVGIVTKCPKKWKTSTNNNNIYFHFIPTLHS